MPVYIDDMYKYPMGQFGRMKMSHMIADTDDELHAMADRIGIARKWHQGDHYDVSISKRKLAVGFGTKEITLQQCSAMTMCRRWGFRMPPPALAEAHVKFYRSRRHGASGGRSQNTRAVTCTADSRTTTRDRAANDQRRRVIHMDAHTNP